MILTIAIRFAFCQKNNQVVYGKMPALASRQISRPSGASAPADRRRGPFSPQFLIPDKIISRKNEWQTLHLLSGIIITK
jgi:hypothetical protein